MGNTDSGGPRSGRPRCLGADQCPATIATRARQYDYLFTTWVTIKEADSGQMGQVASGVFHHLDEIYPKIFHHRPIHFNHLLGGQVGYFPGIDS